MPDPQSFLITDIINDVKRGLIKIPQFQREFVWSKEKAMSPLIVEKNNQIF